MFLIPLLCSKTLLWLLGCHLADSVTISFNYNPNDRMKHPLGLCQRVVELDFEVDGFSAFWGVTILIFIVVMKVFTSSYHKQNYSTIFIVSLFITTCNEKASMSLNISSYLMRDRNEVNPEGTWSVDKLRACQRGESIIRIYHVRNCFQ